jgi:hypothetical protein
MINCHQSLALSLMQLRDLWLSQDIFTSCNIEHSSRQQTNGRANRYKIRTRRYRCYPDVRQLITINTKPRQSHDGSNPVARAKGGTHAQRTNACEVALRRAATSFQ